ncbi:MAG: hypothetical protein DMF82_13445 [Acidobacteria bacterium]|nr:MAG: hypothetical protein DMF82_13445 [Acidobacteriota bacterium]
MYHTATLLPSGYVLAAGGGTSSAELYGLLPVADLAISKSDRQTTASPGQTVIYTITGSNAGPTAANGATVTDTVPAAFMGATWTCVAAGGATCTAGPVSGNINDTVDLPAGGTVTYTLTGQVAVNAQSLSNTATITLPPHMFDPNTADNSATDTDLLVCNAEKVLVPDGLRGGLEDRRLLFPRVQEHPTGLASEQRRARSIDRLPRRRRVQRQQHALGNGYDRRRPVGWPGIGPRQLHGLRRLDVLQSEARERASRPDPVQRRLVRHDDVLTGLEHQRELRYLLRSGQHDRVAAERSADPLRQLRLDTRQLVPHDPGRPEGQHEHGGARDHAKPQGFRPLHPRRPAGRGRHRSRDRQLLLESGVRPARQVRSGAGGSLEEGGYDYPERFSAAARTRRSCASAALRTSMWRLSTTSRSRYAMSSARFITRTRIWPIWRSPE